VFIKPGAVLNITGGSLNPGTTFIQGRVVVTEGSLTGEFIIMSSTGQLVVSGEQAKVRSLEEGFAIAGEIEVSDGGEVTLASTTLGTGVTITVSDGGKVWALSPELDAESDVTVADGGTWVSGGTAEYHGALVARAGSEVSLAGIFHSLVDLDQETSVTRGWLVLDQGLSVEVDGTADSVAPIVPPYGQNNSTYLSGPLTVRVRNSNALRVGDVIPIFRHEAGDTQAFSGLMAPEIGGGRVLTLVREGNPATTSVVVVQGAPSCYTSDFNGDGDFGTDQDIEAFFACLGGSCCAACGAADFNGDGDVDAPAEVEAFFRVLSGTAC
jgi:hypothetical protein